jgi:hypothetical protein
MFVGISSDLRFWFFVGAVGRQPLLLLELRFAYYISRFKILSEGMRGRQLASQDLLVFFVA